MSVRSFVRPFVCPSPISPNSIKLIIPPYQQPLHNITTQHLTQHISHNITCNITHTITYTFTHKITHNITHIIIHNITNTLMPPSVTPPPSKLPSPTPPSAFDFATFKLFSLFHNYRWRAQQLQKTVVMIVMYLILQHLVNQMTPVPPQSCLEHVSLWTTEVFLTKFSTIMWEEAIRTGRGQAF